MIPVKIYLLKDNLQVYGPVLFVRLVLLVMPITPNNLEKILEHIRTHKQKLLDQVLLIESHLDNYFQTNEWAFLKINNKLKLIQAIKKIFEENRLKSVSFNKIAVKISV